MIDCVKAESRYDEMAEPTHLLRVHQVGDDPVEFTCYGKADVEAKKAAVRDFVFPVLFEVEELREGS